jgi:hypothetical protein
MADITPILEVAMRGESLETCEDVKKTVNSLKNTIKEYNTYTGTLSSTTSNYNPSVTINHGLGIYPQFEVYVKLDSESIYRKLPYIIKWFDASDNRHKIEIGKKHYDANNIYIQLRTKDRLTEGEVMSLDYIAIINLISDTDVWF